MSQLTIYTNDAYAEFSTSDHAVISEKLADADILFEHWSNNTKLPPDAEQDDILAAYEEDIERLNTQYHFQSVDVINITPATPNIADIRAKFLQEHTHDDFEMRLFVRGQGLFNIRTHGKIYAVHCTENDLISVPANTTHWFDTGASPTLTAIRLFANPDGWIPNFTGSSIAERFPLLQS